jgi:hypothetical protein
LGEDVYKSEFRQEINHIFYNLDRIFGGSGGNLKDCHDSDEIKLYINWALVGGKYQMDRVFLTEEQKEKIRVILYKKFEEKGVGLDDNKENLKPEDGKEPSVEKREAFKMAELVVVKPFKNNSTAWAIEFNVLNERQKRAYQVAILNLKALKDLGVFHQSGVGKGNSYQFFEMLNSDDDDPLVGKRLEALFSEIHEEARKIYDNAVSF